ncbi:MULTISPECIES: class I adenylate-forming enzyme family protein [unclassified Streptomyces]|uniref:class I adenylate-forming enzyme family protein n=1 Tax=unclassified Streptomyces TaxID=2593676 RepID=UPI002030C6FF|nr:MULTISPECIES: class I adenylate-forming enzyme family protein [unclassified Streptomyces]MCM1975129.1 acyl--CoA ligase [Streptomyces sp. G1]MCX5122740.1 acyl--CoA ligase [Streptomyces sp. NBC_00347]MCX5296095.1 acyl--CoA ligase [Streptomyces sp. NBC_00193]
MRRNSIHKQGLYLGSVPERAAVANGATPLTLDHDLDVLPGAGRRLTVAELAGHVEDLAGRISAAGVKAGEHVVVHKAANFDVWLLATAVARTGAVPVMLSHTLDGPTLAALMERLDKPHLLTDGPKLEALAGLPLAELTRSVISVGESAPGVVSLAELAGSPGVRPRLQGLDEPAMITHTSGTTGIPKLVVHTPRTMRARLRPQLVLLALMRKRETVAIHIAFGHSRMFAAMALCLTKGMPVLLVNRGAPEDVAEFFLKHRPGLIEALPNSFLAWENLADDPRKPFASVKYFSSTFDAIHPRTVRRLLGASARRAQFFQIYGQSEVGPAVGRPYYRWSAHRMDGRCVGYPLPGSARVRLVSQNGKRPSAQNPGLIDARWDGIAKTYHGEQERYDANVHDGWWRTGDVGYRSKFGCLHMLDREIDMIPGVGSSLEIEDLVLDKLEELVELVVVLGPDSRGVPIVCTHGDEPLDRDRWRTAVAAYPQLADPIQIPLAELPRTATMKTRRVELSRRLEEKLLRQG